MPLMPHMMGSVRRGPWILGAVRRVDTEHAFGNVRPAIGFGREPDLRRVEGKLAVEIELERRLEVRRGWTLGEKSVHAFAHVIDHPTFAGREHRGARRVGLQQYDPESLEILALCVRGENEQVRSRIVLRELFL